MKRKLKEQVKKGEISPGQAIQILEKDASDLSLLKKSHTYKWLTQRQSK